jgi:hypothetical protein
MLLLLLVLRAVLAAAGALAVIFAVMRVFACVGLGWPVCVS